MRGSSGERLAGGGRLGRCGNSDGDKQAIFRASCRGAAIRAKNSGQTRSWQQVIVANVDTAFIVVALDGDFNLRRLERLSRARQESGATAVVLFE